MIWARQDFRLAIVFAASLALVGCTIELEPSYDEKLVNEVDELAKGTEVLIVSVQTEPAAYMKREKLYPELTARSSAIVLFASARPAPSGLATGIFNNVLHTSNLPSIIASERRPGGEVTTDDRYAVATVGFMEDYQRVLKKLWEEDKRPGSARPSKTEFNILLLRDIMSDALFYERVVLDRGR